MFNITHFLTEYARIDETEHRTQCLNNALSNPSLREIIERSIESNNVEQLRSPILHKIRSAIKHPNEQQNNVDAFAKQRFQHSPSEVARPQKKRRCNATDLESIELQLIRKNFEAVKAELNANPRVIYELSSTFKIHLKLGTFTINELLDILDCASQRMIDIQHNNGVVSTSPFQLRNYSSIIRLFSKELHSAAKEKSLNAIPPSLYAQNSESVTPLESFQFWIDMLNYSPSACQHLFSSMPLNYILKLLTFEDRTFHCLLEYETSFHAILPYLLDSIPSHYMFQILTRSILSKATDTPIDFSKLNHLSNLQLIRFITIICEASALKNSLDIESFPSPLKEFHRVLEQREILNLNLDIFSENDGHAAIANLMEAWSISVKSICHLIPNINLKLLAKHLRYVDLREYEDSKNLLCFLANNTQISTLYIKDPTIVQIPLNLNHCLYLNCGGCKSLLSLPKLPECIQLMCWDCPAMTRLPTLSRCEQLTCWGCIQLKDFPPLPKCKKLICSNCPSLREIHDLSLCEHVECRNCKELQLLPELLSCKFLDCFGCKALERIPSIPKCLELHCGGCPKVRSLPQQISQHLLMFSSNIHDNLQEMNVDTEYFKKAPKELLLYWGYYLTNSRSLPNIVYYTGKERSEGCDGKGMTRDFITNLMQNIFKPLKEMQSAEVQEFLAIEEGLPYEMDHEDQESYYKVLGWILALAYIDAKSIKTGPLFSERFYDCLQTKGEPSLDSSSFWPLQNWLKIIEAPLELQQILDEEMEDPEEISDKTLQYLSFLIDSTGTTPINKELLDDHEERQLIIRQLLQEAIKDKRVRALSYIADAFYYYLGEKLCDEILVHNPISLRRKIEGKISKKLLMKKVSWINEGPVDKSNLNLEQYLKKWVSDLNQDNLIKFLRSISGLAAVPNIIKCNINHFAEPNSIPTVQTCSYEIFFSKDYDNQEIFNDRMNTFIEYALSGNGYQML